MWIPCIGLFLQDLLLLCTWMPLTHPGQHLQRNEQGRGKQTNSYTQNFPPSSGAATRVLLDVCRHRKQSATELLSCRNFRCLQLFALETLLLWWMTVNYLPVFTPDISTPDSPRPCHPSPPCLQMLGARHLGTKAASHSKRTETSVCDYVMPPDHKHSR
jgi:hypothetical protein